MNKILLISVEDVKDISSLSENITPKYLRPAIVQAQDEGLQGIVGECLYEKLMQVAERLIDGKELDEDKPYADLLDQCTDYLGNLAIVKALPRVSFKIDNMGVSNTDDENIRQVTRNDMIAQQDFYQHQVDFYCGQLQNYLLRNRESFPELRECDCNRIKSNLNSSASCGLWLGGRRGRKVR